MVEREAAQPEVRLQESKRTVVAAGDSGPMANQAKATVIMPDVPMGAASLYH
jgi:hypothetical protein